MEKNYFVYHLHSDYSSCITNIDSATKIDMYINRAHELGMKALAFSEHGSTLNWHEKKTKIEATGMKYVHAAEVYLTETIDEKIRDNYHCVLIAKNFEGFKELNKLISHSFNRNDNHFYYVPRITMEELMNTSNNLIVTSACFDEDTDVVTKEGVKNIKAVKRGDYVLTHDGTYKKVNFPTSRDFTGDMYQIKSQGMIKPIKCTYNHQFLKYDNGAKWCEAENLNKNDILLSAIDTHVDYNEYLDLNDCRNNNTSKSIKKRLKNYVIPITKELLILLGIYCAEGSFLYNKSGIMFTLDSRNDRINNFVINTMRDIFGIEGSIRTKNNGSANDVSFSSTEIYNVFSKLFRSGAKNKDIPEFIKYLSPSIQMFFIKGLYMGDGYYQERITKGYKSHRINVTTISKDLAYSVMQVFYRNNINPNITISKAKVDKNNVNHSEAYYIDINSDLAYKLKQFVFDDVDFDINNCKLLSSQKIIVNGDSKFAPHKINQITKLPDSKQKVYCLSVEDNHSFMANNIIVHNCLGGIICKGNDSIKERFIEWMIEHSDRCFLEIQHHNVEKQKGYNRYLLDLHKKTGLRLVAGTDTHNLNAELAEARIILQHAKNTYFSDEEGWDLTFKTYNELVSAYEAQNSIPMEYVLDAINNTNIIEEMIEPFEIDTTPKYPKLYDDSVNIFRKMVYESIDTHPYALKNHTREEIVQRIEEELVVYEATGMIDFMLFQKFVRDWEHKNNIFTGPARGSVSGSFIAYLLQITDMDSIKFDLNFFRFANKDRVSNADVDSDYYDPDRVKVRNFLLTYPKIKSAEIAAFGTIKLKGAIRDVGRALNIPLDVVGNICKRIAVDEQKQEYVPDDLRTEYPELFKFVDLLNGVITSVGTHPAGVLCASRNIEEEIGLFSLPTTEHPVSCLDMYGLDAGWWTKLDCLGLDNIGIINETCKLAGIERLTPDNTDLNDWEVWKDIREDTTCIFQFESSFASQSMKQMFSDEVIAKIKIELPDISYLKLMSFVNALIRPCGASVRDKAITGEIHRTGIPDIDNMLSAELGNCIIQEDIMNFLMKFCGYTLLEADKARKAIAKKKGTEELLPAIKNGFIENSKEKYNLSDKKVDDIINPILKCILDATRYAFSWNHSDAYSFIGYACGYLRHYYPLEFITTCLNIWQDKEDKTANVVMYAGKHGYKIKEPQFRYSKSDYFFDKDTKTIYKGMRSIKHLNEQCSNELYSLRNNTYNSFVELLYDIVNININSRQIEILIKLDYFKEFGNPKELLQVYNMFHFFKNGEAKTISKEKLSNDEILYGIIKRYSNETDKQFNKLNVKEILKECENYIKCQRLTDFNWKEKIAIQQEYLGYINLYTGEEKDRPKLIVLKKQTLISKIGKNKGKPWCVMIQTQSIGSNIKGSFTIPFGIYSKEPFNEMDIIYCDKWERRKGYNYILEYHQIF